MAKVFIEETTLTAIGDAIRGKEGSSELVPVNDMATRISAISGGGGGGDLPEELFVISGDCTYKFAYGSWNSFLGYFGDKLTTKDITNCMYMFAQNKTLTHIPFDLNIKINTSCTCEHFCQYCEKLEEAPKIYNIKIGNINQMFANCRSIRQFPDDYGKDWDWSYHTSATSGYIGNKTGLFQGCYSLRKLPYNLLDKSNPLATINYSYFNQMAQYCYALDEIVNLPIPYNATWTSNSFSQTFAECGRVSHVTFATPDGQPYVKSWKSQTIDLSNRCGYVPYESYLSNYNSGITLAKQVKDAATYEALKNDPDWFTLSEQYSRYNHDSAVETINSLPDTSAYLATAGGTNTIKFKGAAGSATDGGAINTLTEEEIAVAAAKGWTVSFA